eukprot:1160014-Pelagomonas_calceolata.AAC.3
MSVPGPLCPVDIMTGRFPRLMKALRRVYNGDVDLQEIHLAEELPGPPNQFSGPSGNAVNRWCGAIDYGSA